MSLTIKCENCGSEFVVKGHTTPDGWTEPGEVVTDLELVDETDELCGCLSEGGAFMVTDEDYDVFDDDVI